MLVLSLIKRFQGVNLNLTKKREKPEDFIGWKSPDGKLEVVGIAGKDKWSVALFKVTCTECSKDKELFPDGYFVSTKSNFQHYVDWSTECFQNDCQYILNKLLTSEAYKSRQFRILTESYLFVWG